MDHTENKSVAMVRVYTRRPDAFSDHAGDGLLQPSSLAGADRGESTRRGLAASGSRNPL